MKASEMATLFDVSIEDTLDNKEAVDDNNDISFEKKCKDIQSVMEKEPQLNEDTEIIKTAIKQTEPQKKSIQKEIPMDIPGDIVKEVDKDIAEFEQSMGILEEVTKTDSFTGSKDNPLGFVGDDLKAYHEIKQKYPQFILYDGSVAFKSFYQQKSRQLKSLLTRFPILDLKEIADEIRTTDINHFIGESIADANLIQKKLDDAYRWKARLASILIDIIEQYYVWERMTELLRSKLWKDHPIKGSHNRDGLVLEHIADMEEYLATMKGVMESGKHMDGMLKAATESLSRQLTCIQIREFRREKIDPSQKTEKQSPFKSLDGLDGMDDGTVIDVPTPSPNNAAVPIEYGQKDELSELGI